MTGSPWVGRSLLRPSLGEAALLPIHGTTGERNDLKAKTKGKEKKMKRMTMVAIAAILGVTRFLPSAYAADAPTLALENVMFRNRSPWSGLVDIDCKVNCSNPMTNILLYVFAKDTISNKPLVVKSVWLANDATHTNALSVVAGTHRLVWGAGSDNPGLVPEAVSVKVSASLESALYLVVDLSGGADAESYPISYLNAVPEGGWTDEHKTTKLVLRRIQPGTFTMGQRSTDVPGWSDSGLHEVTISHPFYIGVFEVTQKQYELVTGSNPSKYKGDARPVECVSCDMIRGEFSTYHWPMSKNVDPSSFMGRLRSKTTLNGFDLPTESQWEYACRAGTTTGLNNGKNLTNNGSGTDPQLNEVGRYWYNRSDGRGGYSDAHANVGSYQPNAWGLYDMHGNVWERCLDLYGSYPNKAVTDPKGASSGTNVVTRGGGYWDYAYRCASSNRGYDSSSYYLSDSGFRLCCRYGVATESPDVSRDIVFASPSLGNGLVGYWRFDGNANDSSGNGNDGVIQGVKLTEDRHGNANSAGMDGDSLQGNVHPAKHWLSAKQEVGVGAGI